MYYHKSIPYILALLLFLITTNAVKAQDEEEAIEVAKKKFDIEAAADELLENLASDSEDADIDFDTYLETLYDYAENPLSINEMTEEDLSSLPLSLQQQNSLLEYRQKHGGIISIYELQGIPGFNPQTASLLSNYLSIDSYPRKKIPLKRLLVGGKQQFLLRYQQVLETPKAFIPDTVGGQAKFLGDKSRLYARYRYTSGTKLSYGITAEKDPGEEFFAGTQKRGFDFYSAHFFINNVGPFKYLALGDYEVRLGQGLVAWSGLGFRKGTYVMDVARRAKPLKQYTSVDENNFYRGAAFTLDIGKKIDLTAFASYKRIDANLLEPRFQVIDGDTIEVSVEEEAQEASNDLGVGVTSLQASGYHRTESELFDKDAINQLHLGGNLKYRGDHFTIGINALYMKLDTALQSNQQGAPHNQYRFQGDQLINASIDYRWVLPGVSLFGETAISDNGGFAIFNGALVNLHKTIQLSLVHRHYDKKYQSLNSAAFAEGSSPANERGFFLGSIFQPIPKWSLTTYVDVYKHPWLRYLTDSPSYGTDYLAELTYKHSRKVNMYVRYRNETKKKNAVLNETPADYVVNEQKTSLRFNVKYKLSGGFVLQSRVEGTRFDNGVNGPEHGYAIIQDVNFRPSELPFTISTRFALFDTESYASRVYAYENDVLYAFNVPPYYNRGSRFYMVGKYQVSRALTIWLRYAQTYFADQSVISSGDNEIQGQTKSEFKAMLRFKF